jgi:hypothetical protein
MSKHNPPFRVPASDLRLDRHLHLVPPNYTGVIVTPPQQDGDMASTEKNIEDFGPLVSVIEPSPAMAGSFEPLWHINPVVTIRQPSAHDQLCRSHATVLAFRAADIKMQPGAEIFGLYRVLEKAIVPSKRARAIRAVAATLASAYLRVAPEGLPFLAMEEVVVDGSIGLGAPVDAIAWSQPGKWVIDLISVAKREGQFRSDCSAGRVQRCVRLATRLSIEEQVDVDVRMFAPGRTGPALVAEVTFETGKVAAQTPIEVQGFMEAKAS